MSVVSEFEIWGFWGKVRKCGMKFWVERVNEIARRLLLHLGKKILRRLLQTAATTVANVHFEAVTR